MLTQNEAMGAAIASDGGIAPIASFWVRIMTPCINIKRGVLGCQRNCWKSSHIFLNPSLYDVTTKYTSYLFNFNILKNTIIGML